VFSDMQVRSPRVQSRQSELTPPESPVAIVHSAMVFSSFRAIRRELLELSGSFSASNLRRVKSSSNSSPGACANAMTGRVAYLSSTTNHRAFRAGTISRAKTWIESPLDAGGGGELDERDTPVVTLALRQGRRLATKTSRRSSRR